MAAKQGRFFFKFKGCNIEVKVTKTDLHSGRVFLIVNDSPEDIYDYKSGSKVETILTAKTSDNHEFRLKYSPGNGKVFGGTSDKVELYYDDKYLTSDTLMMSFLMKAFVIGEYLNEGKKGDANK